MDGFLLIRTNACSFIRYLGHRKMRRVCFFDGVPEGYIAYLSGFTVRTKEKETALRRKHLSLNRRNLILILRKCIRALLRYQFSFMVGAWTVTDSGSVCRLDRMSFLRHSEKL